MAKLTLIFDIKIFLCRNRGQNKRMMSKTIGLFITKKQVGDMKQPPSIALNPIVAGICKKIGGKAVE